MGVLWVFPKHPCANSYSSSPWASEARGAAPKWIAQIEALVPGVRRFERDGIPTFYGPHSSADAADAFLKARPVKHVVWVTHQLKRLEAATAKFLERPPFAGAPTVILADNNYPLTNRALGKKATLIHLSNFSSHALDTNAEVIHLFGGSAAACIVLTSDNCLRDLFETQIRRESVTIMIYPQLVYISERTLAERWSKDTPAALEKDQAEKAGMFVNPWLNHHVEGPVTTDEGVTYTFRYKYGPRTIKLVFAPIIDDK